MDNMDKPMVDADFLVDTKCFHIDEDFVKRVQMMLARYDYLHPEHDHAEKERYDKKFRNMIAPLLEELQELWKEINDITDGKGKAKLCFNGDTEYVFGIRRCKFCGSLGTIRCFTRSAEVVCSNPHCGNAAKPMVFSIEAIEEWNKRNATVEPIEPIVASKKQSIRKWITSLLQKKG